MIKHTELESCGWKHLMDKRNCSVFKKENCFLDMNADQMITIYNKYHDTNWNYFHGKLGTLSEFKRLIKQIGI